MRWYLSWRYGHVTLVSGYRFDTCQLTIIWMSIIRLKTGYGLPHQLENQTFHIGVPMVRQDGWIDLQRSYFKNCFPYLRSFSFSSPFPSLLLFLELLGLQKICQMLTKNSTILSKCAISKWQAAFQVIWHQCCSFRRIQIHNFMVTP